VRSCALPQALLGTRSVSGTRGCWNPYCFSLEALTHIGALPFKHAAGVEFRGHLADRAWLT
jgi:hypothetical protein